MRDYSVWGLEVAKAVQKWDIEKVASFLDGADFGVGQIEELQETCKNLRLSYARLLVMLAARQVLTCDDVAQMILENFGSGAVPIRSILQPQEGEDK